MFKAILSALVVLGLGSVAYANDPAAAPTGAPADTTKTEMPADATAAPGKKAHGDHAAKMDKKAKKAKKEAGH